MADLSETLADLTAAFDARTIELRNAERSMDRYRRAAISAEKAMYTYFWRYYWWRNAFWALLALSMLVVTVMTTFL